MFKHDYAAEEYTKCRSIRYSDRRSLSLAQIRCTSANIYIETCHYNSGIYLPVEDHICPVCHENIEDESHVMSKCNAYDNLRKELFDLAEVYNPSFNDLSDKDKFVFLVSNVDVANFV